MNWSELKIFQSVDLCDSFILEWSYLNNVLTFKVEASLWPGSLFYKTPKANEYTCYRIFELKITEVLSCVGLLPLTSVQPNTDPDGTSDYGAFDTFLQTSDGFTLSGEFGNVTITGGELNFSIAT